MSLGYARRAADIDAEVQRILARGPRTSEQRAELEEVRRQSLARGEADLNARLADWATRTRAEAEARFAGLQGEAEAEVRRRVRELEVEDRVAGYLRTHEEAASETLAEERRTDIIREECWAQHEGLYTFTSIGGSDPELILDLVLWLNTPECRAHLNLR